MSDLNPHIDRPAKRYGTLVQLLSQSLSHQELRDQVGRTLVDAESVNRKDVWMVQSCGRLCLLLKAPQPVGIFRHKRWKNLDGNVSLQNWVSGAINLAHPSGAQQAQNLVAIDFRAWGQCHVEADYTCTPWLLTEPPVMGAMPFEARYEQLDLAWE